MKIARNENRTQEPREPLTRSARVAPGLPAAGAGERFARTVKQKKQAARAQFETAERLRDDRWRAKPEAHRTRRDYQKVIDAYRKVYYTAPSSVKADASVLAVAELLDDQGRILNDPKSFQRCHWTACLPAP